MAANATLVFSCCPSEGQSGSCIEYSWVPTGRRHTIKLSQGGPSGARTDPDAAVTMVQVYSLRHGRYGQAQTANGWMFPAGPPPQGKALAGAVVHVVGSIAYGYGLYDDGAASAVEKHMLQPVPPFECGEQEPRTHEGSK